MVLEGRFRHDKDKVRISWKSEPAVGNGDFVPFQAVRVNAASHRRALNGSRQLKQVQQRLVIEEEADGQMDRSSSEHLCAFFGRRCQIDRRGEENLAEKLRSPLERTALEKLLETRVVPTPNAGAHDFQCQSFSAGLLQEKWLSPQRVIRGERFHRYGGRLTVPVNPRLS